MTAGEIRKYVQLVILLLLLWFFTGQRFPSVRVSVEEKLGFDLFERTKKKFWEKLKQFLDEVE